MDKDKSYKEFKKMLLCLAFYLILFFVGLINIIIWKNEALHSALFLVALFFGIMAVVYLFRTFLCL